MITALAGCATVPEGRFEDRFLAVAVAGSSAQQEMRAKLLPAFDVRGKSVVAALRELTREAEPLGVYFDIAEEALPAETPVNTIFDRATSNKVNFAGFRVPVIDALNAICDAGDVDYSVEGNTVYIPPGGPTLRAATFKCFGDLHEFGLPDVSEGMFVELDTFGDTFVSWPVTNTAAWWLEPDGADGAWLLVNQCETVRIRGHRSHARSLAGFLEDGKRLRWASQKPGEFVGVWRGLDLGVGVRSIPPQCRDMAFRDLAVRSKLFLFAANVARYGREDDAWQIVRFLYGPPESYGKVVNAAAYRLADAKYAEACRRHWRRGARSEFRRELRRLLGRYGFGWRNRCFVQRQLTSLAGGGQAAKADADQKRFLEALDERGVMPHLQLWILSGDLRDLDPKSEYGPRALRVLTRGMRAMPFLLELLDDYTPTKRLWRAEADLSGAEPDNSRPATPVWGDMASRPVTRAELVMRLLDAALWLDVNDRVSVTQDDRFELKKAVYRRWYEKRKAMTAEELRKDRE